jgi:hypothetical protein
MKRVHEDNIDHSSASSKKKKYDQKFLNAWLADPEFKDWLEKRHEVPYCKVCECKFNLVPRVFALSLLERNTLEWTYDVTPRFWVK